MLKALNDASICHHSGDIQPTVEEVSSDMNRNIQFHHVTKVGEDIATESGFFPGMLYINPAVQALQWNWQGAPGKTKHRYMIPTTPSKERLKCQNLYFYLPICLYE